MESRGTMKITVWSIISGQLSGHLVLNVSAAHTVRKVLETYCNYKGVSVSGDYVVRGKDNHILSLNKSLKQSKIRDGETLMLGLQDDEKQTFSYGRWWLITIACLIVGTVGLAFILWKFMESPPGVPKFSVVIDAGSSHSEMFVLSWNGEKPQGTSDVEVVHQCFLPGGIHHFASHVDDLKGYFGHCLSEAITHVPAYLHKETPVYVGATAGMRILKHFHYEGAEAVLATVREIFLANSTFQVNPKHIDILPGSVEGISGWITVNYLMKNLKKPNATSTSTLDIGGASMQLVTELVELDSTQMASLTLFNYTHRVHSQSFLCQGLGESMHRYNFLLINENATKEEEEAPPTGVVFDPCLPVGVTHHIPLEDLEVPCTLTNNSTPNLSGNSHIIQNKMERIFRRTRDGRGEIHTKPDFKKVVHFGEGSRRSSNSVIVQGTSDALGCERKLHQLFNRSLCESTFTYGDCMDAQSVSPITGMLSAFSRWLSQLMQDLDVGPDASLAQFKRVVSSICSLDRAALHSQYAGLQSVRAEDLCFDGMFVYSLLTAGLGINSSTWSNVVFKDKINQRDVAWPQGFMMNLTTAFPSETPPKQLTLLSLILLVCLFLAFIISGFLFFYHSLKIKRHSASYQRCIADHIDQELQRFL